MRKHIILFLLGCLIFNFSNTNAQIIDRKVISSGGIEYSSSYLSISYTIGETFVNTFINNGLILTQGFQQPDVAGCNLQVNQGMDTIIACGPSVMLSADSGFTNYSWSNGDSAQSTSVTASGWYFCSGYQNGCLGRDSIYVSVVNAQININDTTICLGTDIHIEVLESNGAILTYQNNYYQVSGTSPLKPWGPMNNVSTNSSSLSDGLQNTLNAVAALGNYNGGDYAANYCHQLNEKGFTDWYLPSWNELSSMLCNSSGMIPGWVVPAYYWSSTERTDNWAYKGFSGNLSTPCGSVAAPVKTDYCNVRCIRKSSTKTYLWSTGATTPSITITPSQTTVYYVTVSNGISSCTDSVQITISGSPEEIIMEDTISSCADSVLIAALPGFSDLTWSSLQTGPQIHARTTGLYKVIGTNAGGCTVKDSVVVSIVNLNMNNDTSICIGGSVVLSAQSGFPYLNNLFDGSRFLRSVQNGPGGQTQRTFTYWLRTTDSTAMNVLTYGDGSSGTSLLSLMLNLNLSYGAGSGWCAQNNKGVSLFSNSHAATFAKIVHDGKWHHIAYVLGENNQFSFDKIKFYVDGNLISHTPASIPYCGHNWGGWTYNTVATPIKFGAAGWGGPFRGGLSQVGIWNSALDSSDIRRVRNQGVLSIVNDLAHYYPMDKLKQDTIIEDEFGSNDCIIQGNASNISTRAFSGTETLSFLWSNGSTSHTIEVYPTQTTTYYVTVSNGISSCTDSVTVTVLSASTYFTDNDNDGYGDSLLGNFCEPPPGALTDSSDCDGSNPSVNPGATEVCNGIDDDCDGQIDGLSAPSLGPIHGPAVQCIPLAQGIASFYIDSAPDTTGYQWMLPSGLNLLSGQGTDSITIQWPLSMAHTGISGPLSVTLPGICGTSFSTIQLNMQISVPARPPSVSGPIRLCAGDSATYSVFPVARAHFYEWILPAGLHFVGDSTGNIIHVIADSNYLGGFLSVMAVNACGKSLERTKTLTRNIAITPSPISGITNGLCNMQGVIYSVIPQAGYLHSWSLPAGILLVSGQGAASIVVNYTGSFTSGQISVTRSNTCGTSLPRTISVSSVPGRPSSMNGPLNLCPGAMNQPYSSSSVTGATGYQWSVFSGASISGGQGTKNITVDYPFVTTNGQSLSVSALNACGSGPQRTLSGITLSSAYCGRMGEANRNLDAYPNPTGGWLYLRAEGIVPLHIEVYNMLGECVINTAWKTELDMRALPAGMYVLKVRDEEGGNLYRRIEVQR